MVELKLIHVNKMAVRGDLVLNIIAALDFSPNKEKTPFLPRCYHMKNKTSNPRGRLLKFSSFWNSEDRSAASAETPNIFKVDCMMTSSIGNIFRVTVPLCGEFTGEFLTQRLWCFLWSASETTVEETIETPVIWDAMALIVTSL